MTAYFITRHKGALQWAAAHGIAYDIHLEHLTEFDNLNSGDVVIGTLPIHIVYTLNKRGVRYIHLSMQIPPQLRGIELNAEQLNDCQAMLEEFTVLKVAERLIE